MLRKNEYVFSGRLFLLVIFLRICLPRRVSPLDVLKMCLIAKSIFDASFSTRMIGLFSAGLLLGVNSISAQTQRSTAASDDREVYILTSRLHGWVPKVGVMKHMSVAICPKGVPPVIYENGEPVSNWRQCKVYGTQTNKKGFFPEGKRIGVTATRVCGVSATEIERRMRCHSQINRPLLHDCRHHAIAVTGIRGTLFRRKLPLFLR